MYDMERYLASTDIIDWHTPAVRELAGSLSRETVLEAARTCFEWVRDRIAHSGDTQADVVTCRASEVLEQRTGWCYAKSHLLAALLRANGIPAGLCYQRLSRDEGGGFVVHGLNGVHLPEHGWYRVDVRGNKPGVNAQFSPPIERLAWEGTGPGEANFPGIHPTPLPEIVHFLSSTRGYEQTRRELPDLKPTV
mgnify:CR=1 FL=1|jgi:transglutaminase-like putative cysteine protease